MMLFVGRPTTTSRASPSSERAEHSHREARTCLPSALGPCRFSESAGLSLAYSHGTQLPAADSYDAASLSLDESGPPGCYDAEQSTTDIPHFHLFSKAGQSSHDERP